jgi:hypothetical protein
MKPVDDAATRRTTNQWLAVIAVLLAIIIALLMARMTP